MTQEQKNKITEQIVGILESINEAQRNGDRIYYHTSLITLNSVLEVLRTLGYKVTVNKVLLTVEIE